VMLSGTHNEVATPLRIQGYRQALTVAGIAPAEPVTAGWDIQAGYRAAIEVLSRPGRPTGVVCANDRAAVGVVLAARELGLSVPRDVSVVGYDDDDNVAGVMVPALTTVALPHEAMGEEGMRLLLSAIESEHAEPAQVQLPCPLIERDSVAPPRH
jgi:LacI family transcriptional regulator, galactose operon repressor